MALQRLEKEVKELDFEIQTDSVIKNRLKEIILDKVLNFRLDNYSVNLNSIKETQSLFNKEGELSLDPKNKKGIRIEFQLIVRLEKSSILIFGR